MLAAKEKTTVRRETKQMLWVFAGSALCIYAIILPLVLTVLAPR